MLDGQWRECVDDWATEVKKYWRYIGGGDLLVFYRDEWDSDLLTVTNVCSVDKERDGGISCPALFCGRILYIPEDRNYLWHELGHMYTSEYGMSRVLREYLADMWAIVNSIAHGMYDIACEILDRCLSFMCTCHENNCYYCAGKRIVSEFNYLI